MDRSPYDFCKKKSVFGVPELDISALDLSVSKSMVSAHQGPSPILDSQLSVLVACTDNINDLNVEQKNIPYRMTFIEASVSLFSNNSSNLSSDSHLNM